MKFQDFMLERYQSDWENEVDFNLGDSGVHPFTLRELLRPGEIEVLLDLRPGYDYTNGMVETRDTIAGLSLRATDLFRAIVRSSHGVDQILQ